MALQGNNRKHSPGGLKLTHQVALESHRGVPDSPCCHATGNAEMVAYSAVSEC